MMQATAIETPRLVLLAATLEVLRAELENAKALGAVLGAEAPGDWPPEHYDGDAIRYMIALQEREPAALEWGFRYFALKAPRRLVGAGGFTGPAKEGVIEIGYSIVPSAQRQGLASEAANGLIARAFAQPHIERVIAHTLPGLTPSIGVLERCGFCFDGDGAEAGTIRYALARRDWGA